MGTANGTTLSTCAAGTYKAAHNVNYGSTSSCGACTGTTYSGSGAASCTNCPSGYTANTASNKTAATQCQISVAGGKYVGTANSATLSTCEAGTYKAAHTVNYGSTSSCAICTTANTYSSAGASSCSTCPTGYANSGTTAAAHANAASCTISVGAGKYLGTANGTTLSSCAAGTYKAAHTVAYGSTSSCASCGAGTYSGSGAGSCTACSGATQYQDATGQSSCKNVSAGYYKSSNSAQAQCPANYRNGAGAASQAGCTASCAAGTRVATANAACAAITSGNVYMLAHNVTYGNTSAAATSCPSGYSISGTTQADHDAKNDCKISCANGTRVATADATCTGAGTGYYIAAHTVSAGSTSAAATQCPANYRNGAAAGAQSGCQTSCAAGTYVAAANAACTSVGTGYYRAAHNVNYGSTDTRTQCPAGYRDGGATGTESGCAMNVPAKYYLKTAKDSSPTVCAGGTWNPAHTKTYGQTSTCNTCPSGYANGAAGTQQSDCKMTVAAGKYVAKANDATATNCAANTYSTGATVNYGGTSSCSNCPSGYAVAAGSGTAKNKCTISCAAGTRVVSADAACTTPSGNWYVGAHSVASGSTSSVSSCNTGYSISGTTAANHDAAADCSISCAAGYYIPTAGQGCKVCTAGKYCTGGTKNQTETLAVTGNCPAGTYSTGGATSSACTAALSGYTAAVCATDKWSAAGASGCTSCTTANGYHNSGTTAAAHANKTSCVVSCGDGTYVASAGAACTSVGTGYWRAAHTVAEGNTDTRSQCPTGYRDGAATNAESNCVMNVAGGKYVATAKESAASGTCAAGYAKAAHTVKYGGTSSCAACTGATYAASTGQASCTTCPTATNATDVSGYSYYNKGGTNDHTVREGCYAMFKAKTVPNGSMTGYQCYIDKDTNGYGVAATGKICWVQNDQLSCNGGYYNASINDGAVQSRAATLEALWNSVCVNVGAGYWSAANALTRTACASGLTTIGYGAGADEAADCGRILHLGDSKLYLRSTKKTTPSLNVKIGDSTFYGNMSTATKGKLRVKKDSTTYSVHDDSM